MATKTTKAKKAASKPKARKSAAKKPARKRKPPTPAFQVPNTHPFPPGATVGFHPTVMVEWERSIGREPIPKPIKTAKVKANGALEVRGLGGGLWTAVAEVDGRWRYHGFTVS